MISKREDISVALFTLIQGASYPNEIALFTRKYISTADLGGGQLPTICVLVKNEHATMKGHGIPAQWKLEAEIFIFVNTGQPSTEPETVLNNILDAIETALTPLTPFPNNRQTLSGLVYDCRINGTIERDPGFISGVGAAAVPIEITITS